ncbi:MAG TPA: hypothetical protein VMX12_01990 [Acidimicrobiia bacterium]|nr:hypothetical protein [Acidimicrobiia bacterium]
MLIQKIDRRLRDLDAGELLSVSYSLMVENLDTEKRRELDHALMPRAKVAIDDPDLPAELQGMKPPSWWGDGTAEGTLSGFEV